MVLNHNIILVPRFSCHGPAGLPRMWPKGWGKGWGMGPMGSMPFPWGMKGFDKGWGKGGWGKGSKGK